VGEPAITFCLLSKTSILVLCKLENVETISCRFEIEIGAFR
jgi:hypothetical protein